MKLLIAIIVLLTFAFDSPASSWGPSGCGPVGAAGSQYNWKYPADWAETGVAYLYDGATYVGRYDYFTGCLHPVHGPSCKLEGSPVWKRCCDCTAKCKCKCKCECGVNGVCVEGCTCGPVAYNGGLIQGRIGGGCERYTVGDAEVGATLPDFGSRLNVVVIDADKVRRDRVVKDLQSMPVIQSAIIRGYDPGHWHLQDLATRQPAFTTNGNPDIYVVAPSGKVLYRQAGYEGGPAKLGEDLIVALRRADPNRDPSKDPGPVIAPTPAPPEESVWDRLQNLPGWSYIAASIAAAFVLLRGGK